MYDPFVAETKDLYQSALNDVIFSPATVCHWTERIVEDIFRHIHKHILVASKVTQEEEHKVKR